MDREMDIGQREAEETMRALARVEGIFAGAVSRPHSAPSAHPLFRACRLHRRPARLKAELCALPTLLSCFGGAQE